jgi:tripartite-type tricarboxylate transporter receptor subunit TctC
MQTRRAALAAALVIGTALASTARAEFPEKLIEVLVPAGPGSATDTNTRLVVNKIAEQGVLSQPMVVVNVTGGGPLAANRVKDAPPDGHTILVYHVGLLGLNAVGKLPFGAEAFVPLAQTGSTRFLLVAAAEGPYADAKALVDAAKASPGGISEANSIGGASHIATLLLAEEAGFKARVVHVGDGPKRLQSVLGGHSAYTVVSPQEYDGFQGTGIKALAVLGEARNPKYPDVPSAGELGWGIDFSVDTWWFAPKGTPAEVTAKLSEAIARAMADPKLKAAFTAAGVDPVILTGEPLGQRIAAVDAAVKPLAPALGGQ